MLLSCLPHLLAPTRQVETLQHAPALPKGKQAMLSLHLPRVVSRAHTNAPTHAQTQRCSKNECSLRSKPQKHCKTRGFGQPLKLAWRLPPIVCRAPTTPPKRQIQPGIDVFLGHDRLLGEAPPLTYYNGIPTARIARNYVVLFQLWSYYIIYFPSFFERKNIFGMWCDSFFFPTMLYIFRFFFKLLFLPHGL